MLDNFLKHHPALVAAGGVNGERRFRITLPELRSSRQLGDAYLILPKGFPDDIATVAISKEHCLRVPHIEIDGRVCLSGDLGPESGHNPCERLQDLLRQFIVDFVIPWGEGQLDNEFEAEAATYWSIYADRCHSKTTPIAEVYTTDLRPEKTRLYRAKLVLPLRWLIAGENAAFNERFRQALSARAPQVENALVVQIPIPSAFTPSSWPRKSDELYRLVQSRLQTADWDRLQREFSLKQHVVVLLSSPTCNFAYLLPGGPPYVKKLRKGEKPIPTRGITPLNCTRVDPSWTYGRDQHPVILTRQHQRVLVFGCGALGAHIIDHLARAGVGRITVVDPDFMEGPNVGRHLLGAGTLGLGKAKIVAETVGRTNPACELVPFGVKAEAWAAQNSLDGFDLILDLTGEPRVRHVLEVARAKRPTPMLIGWMEPYVAAAHVCLLMSGTSWFDNAADRMERLQAVAWPPEVMQREPACNSEFQAYTPASAAYAVAIVAEAALEMVDNVVESSSIRSWVRGQRYLDKQWPGLRLRDWAQQASEFDGVILQRLWHEQ